MKTEQPSETPSRWWLRECLSSLLDRIHELRNLPDDKRDAAAPRDCDEKPLAPSMLQYHSGRVVDEANALERWLPDNLPALQASGDGKLNALVAELPHALGRIRVMLHPAQTMRVWRPGEVPQHRHLHDQRPVLYVSELGVRAASRMPALRHRLDREAFRLLKRGLPPKSVRRHPRMRQLQRELLKASRSCGEGRPEPESFGLMEARAAWYAHSQIAARIKAWENAQDLLKELHDVLLGRQPEDARLSSQHETPADPNASPSPLPDEDLDILRVLESARRLLRQIDIAEEADKASLRTVSDRLPDLEEAGLVHRPRGKKKGYAITDAGRSRLRQLDGS